MSLICFTDGEEVDTSGEFRIVGLTDGWYVVGRGTLQPCANELEAIAVRDELLRAETSGSKGPVRTG